MWPGFPIILHVLMFIYKEVHPILRNTKKEGPNFHLVILLLSGFIRKWQGQGQGWQWRVLWWWYGGVWWCRGWKLQFSPLVGAEDGLLVLTMMPGLNPRTLNLVIYLVSPSFRVIFIFRLLEFKILTFFYRPYYQFDVSIYTNIKFLVELMSKINSAPI